MLKEILSGYEAAQSSAGNFKQLPTVEAIRSDTMCRLRPKKLHDKTWDTYRDVSVVFIARNIRSGESQYCVSVILIGCQKSYILTLVYDWFILSECMTVLKIKGKEVCKIGEPDIVLITTPFSYVSFLLLSSHIRGKLGFHHQGPIQ